MRRQFEFEAEPFELDPEFDSEWETFDSELEEEWYGEASHGSAPALAAPSIHNLKNNIVRLANQEWLAWDRGRKKESDPSIRAKLREYWTTGARVQAIFREPNWWSAHPWSAAFISWIMRKAGAGNTFRYAAAHAIYTKAAKDNRLANNANPFKAFRLREVRPQAGDLVCRSRAGSGANYDNIHAGHKTHCDIVTEVHPGRLTTIGGNVSNSVSKTAVRLDANGFINQPGYFAVIKVGAPAHPVRTTTPGLELEETTPFDTESEFYDPEFEEESWEEVMESDFRPTPVEPHGGGRIQNKTAPKPSDVVTVSGYGGKRVPLHRLAADAWRALVIAARTDGLQAPLLLPVSGFRDPQHQQRLWNAALARYGSAQEARKWVAPPGGSAHQSGRAIDFYLGGSNSSRNVSRLQATPAYRWLVTNAARFGFYPYSREPWHWEYNPPASA